MKASDNPTNLQVHFPNFGPGDIDDDYGDADNDDEFGKHRLFRNLKKNRHFKKRIPLKNIRGR